MTNVNFFFKPSFNIDVFINLQEHVPPAVAGLVMVNVFQTATFIPFVMNLKANLVAFINSLARNFEYTNLKEEAPAIIESNRPSPDWPQSGDIRLNNVSFRYRPELPLVLKGISVNIGNTRFVIEKAKRKKMSGWYHQ